MKKFLIVIILFVTQVSFSQQDFYSNIRIKKTDGTIKVEFDTIGQIFGDYIYANESFYGKSLIAPNGQDLKFYINDDSHSIILGLNYGDELHEYIKLNPSGELLLNDNDFTDQGGFKLQMMGNFFMNGYQNLIEQSTNPSAGELTSGSNAKDRLGFYMKADKLVFAYNNAGTVTYLSIPLDGSTTTWTHSTSAP